MQNENTTALTVRGDTSLKGNNTFKTHAIIQGAAGSADYVPHLNPGQVKLLAIVAARKKLHGERNALLIKLLFDGCLRVSEALRIREIDIQKTDDGFIVVIHDSKNDVSMPVAISASIAAELDQYVLRHGIDRQAVIFPISRTQVFRIITQAFNDSGITMPTVNADHVGRLHVLRHSGAIERLKITQNPKAIQHQLRHRSALTTLRYMKTISADESLVINQNTEMWR